MTCLNRCASLLACLVTLSLLAGCSESWPADGATCEASVCSSHGMCTYQETHPSCACEAGYTGIVCSRCSAGFHRAADSTCVADQTCMPGLCGSTGLCSVVDGLALCQCALGYSGASCSSCRAGFHAEADAGCTPDLECLSSTCAGGAACSADAGRVSCSCPTGRSGAFCEVASERCEVSNPCSSHGSCLDTGGVVRCACELGYSGPTCASCYPGFAVTDADAGVCVQADLCIASSCSFAGECSVDGGVTSCACAEGYTGATCTACALGFHRGPDYRCVANQTCAAANPCALNVGTCVEVLGEVRCQCSPGFAGVTCEACAPGYHALPDAGCALDRECRPESCRFHGACEADAGTISCTCETGFSGSNCQTNIDDCTNSACASGQCVDLISTNVCLCSGGTYGQVCP